MSTSTPTPFTTSTPPRLWISPGTCSLAPHVLMLETGLPHTLFKIDVTKGGFPEEYRKINPKGRIPILELDGETITETSAIMTAISLLSPSSYLFGTTPLHTIRVYEWFNWLSGTVHERGFGAMFTPKWYSDEASAHAGISKKSREWLDTCFGLIEERLTGSKGKGASGKHAVGEVFTAADVFLWVVYRWGYLIRVNMEGLYPNWTKVVNEVVKRDAVRKACEIEGIPLVKDDRLGEGLEDNFERNQDNRGHAN